MSTAVRVELNNPAILRWAREAGGYSLEDIAHLVHRPVDEVNAWERGEAALTYRQLEKIANKVKRPVAVFFLAEVPTDPPLPADHRTLPQHHAGVFTPETLLAFREARNTLAEMRELLELLEYDLVYALPEWTLHDDPARQAAILRAQLDIPLATQIACADHYKAMDLWRSVLFDHGVVIQFFPIPLKDVRAFCLFDHSLAAIGLSSKDADYARIFSLFHEVCHLCLGRPGVSGEMRRVAVGRSADAHLEQYCDRFAAAFLLPEHEADVQSALEQFGATPTREHARRLENRFKVSKYVILRRAYDLGKIASNLFWMLFDEWRQEDARLERRSAGGDYVNTRLNQVGKRMSTLVFDALDQGLITTYDASKLLSLNPKHFPRIRRSALERTG
ncbi:MAG: ImmA/IrrE family metallo-endopeptidase [Armatimonadota bacterium]